MNRRSFLRGAIATAVVATAVAATRSAIMVKEKAVELWQEYKKGDEIIVEFDYDGNPDPRSRRYVVTDVTESTVTVEGLSCSQP